MAFASSIWTNFSVIFFFLFRLMSTRTKCPSKHLIQHNIFDSHSHWTRLCIAWQHFHFTRMGRRKCFKQKKNKNKMLNELASVICKLESLWYPELVKFDHLSCNSIESVQFHISHSLSLSVCVSLSLSLSHLCVYYSMIIANMHTAHKVRHIASSSSVMLECTNRQWEKLTKNRSMSDNAHKCTVIVGYQRMKMNKCSLMMLLVNSTVRSISSTRISNRINVINVITLARMKCMPLTCHASHINGLFI